MRLTTRELHNLDDLLPNRRGLLLMTALITLAMAANGVVIVLMALQGELLNPYIDAALVVNIFTLTVMVITMFNRNLFYTPHLVRFTIHPF